MLVRLLKEAVSDTEITDEMVRAAWDEFGNEAIIRAVLTAALPHSPLLAKYDAAIERAERAERRNLLNPGATEYADALVAENKALKGENDKLQRVVDAAQEINRCSYPVPAETLLKHHRWAEFSAALDALAAPTQGENGEPS